MTATIILLVATGVLAALATYTYMGRDLVSSQEAKRLLLSGNIQVVLDVRTRAEYSAGHYPGARHIPVTEMDATTTAGLPRRGILVYCNTGQRARFAAEKLRQLGFEDVVYIAGPYTSLL